MRAIVDRIEDGIVTLEIGTDYFNISLQTFPKEIREGDLIEYKDGEIIILAEQTKARAEKITDLFNSLLEKDD